MTGNWRWMETVITDLREKPAIGGIMAVSRDITERLGAEEELKNSEKKYKSLFEFSPIAKWIYELESLKILDVNHTAIELYGYTREEFLNMTIGNLRPEEEIPNMVIGVERARQRLSHINYGTYVHQKKDKSLLKVEVASQPFDYMGKSCRIVDCFNVTERETALERLKNKEQKLITAQKIARMGYWELNLSDQSLFWSDELYNIWGITKDNSGMLYETLLKSIHPDDLTAFQLQNSAAAAGEKPLDFQHRIILPDGSIKWIHERGNVTYDDAGKIISFEGTAQDITAFKRVTAALAESNQRYEYVTRATSEAIWDWDLITDNIYWGESFEPIFGYSVEGLNHNPGAWQKLIHPDDYCKILDDINKAKEGKQLFWTNEYRFLKADKTYAHVLDKGFFIRDETGKAIRMVGAMQDISQKKEEENRLRLLETIVINSKEGISISEAYPSDDSGPKLIYVNEAVTKITGYSAEELIGKTPAMLRGPKTVGPELEKLEKAIQEWQPCEINLINYKKNGEEFWANFSINPVTDDKGNYTYWVAIQRDRTEQKKIEDALQSAYEEKENILESIGDGFYAVNKNWIVTYWNKEAERIINIKREEIVGKNIWDFFKNSAEPYFSYYQKAIEQNSVIHFEEYYKKANIWAEVSAFPSKNGLSVFFKDITERREANEKMRVANERFERVSEATHDAIWDIDLRTNILYLGDGFSKLWGPDYEKELHGIESWFNHVHPDDRQMVQDLLYGAIQNKKIRFVDGQYRYLRSDNTYIHIKANVSVIRDEEGNAIRLVGAFQDMTPQKEYEKSLKNLNANLEKVNKELAVSNAELEQFAYIASHDLQEPLRMVTGFLTQIERKYNDVIDEKGKQYIHFAVDGAKRMRKIILDLLEFSRAGRREEKLQEVDLNELVAEIVSLHNKKIHETNASIHYS